MNQVEQILNKLRTYLKPEGVILFRDYGRYDMSQLRFKNGRCVSDNFYVRGEGTFVYFFDRTELGEMARKCGYNVTQLISDKRLQVNRKTQVKMYRVWIQARFQKPSDK